MQRSTCLRRQYGVVIVKADEIIATGYNGAPRGLPNCCDVGSCYRDEHKIPHGEQYEKCIGVHAEMNAIISASRRDMIGSILYLACNEPNAFPCVICCNLIINAGISKVIARENFFDVKKDWIDSY